MSNKSLLVHHHIGGLKILKVCYDIFDIFDIVHHHIDGLKINLIFVSSAIVAHHHISGLKSIVFVNNRSVFVHHHIDGLKITALKMMN